VLGVTAMALGTAVLLLGARDQPRPDTLVPVFTGLSWFGRLSYELYLFHLILLGAIRTMFPPRAVLGDEKLLLLAAFFALSALLSAAVARLYAEPLNRSLRRHLVRPAVTFEA
jgi:peptidoglycan/LPS O-acetylase OafA/YrhL